MTRPLRLGALLAIAVAAGCNFNKDEHEDFCRSDEDCGMGAHCVEDFCVRDEDADHGGADAASSDAGGRADGGGEGEPCEEGQDPEPCYDGAAATRDVGMCRGGERVCAGGTYTQCLGQVLPASDTCNGEDDDCDGTVDEIEASCPAEGTGLPGICGEGRLVCSGPVAVCTPVNQPRDEECNGLDDDCDQSIDEIVPVECFPAGATGCTVNQDGTTTCAGLCHTGFTACDSGQSQCEGAVTAADQEVCNSGSQLPSDDDCDANVDEGCSCSTGQSRACYGGPVGTEDNEPCHAGTQVCVGGVWGTCEGQTLPEPESCQNEGADNDCNGTRDDLPGIGDPCIDDTQLGICREGTKQCDDEALPVCVGQRPQQELCDEVDQNCNGDPYDGFDLNSDDNCGECGHKCEGDTHCCELMCRSEEDFRHDAENCGSCGRACGDGYYCCWNDCLPGGDGFPGTFGGETPPKGAQCGCSEDCKEKWCCGESCVDIMNDDHNCGACGNDCTTGTIRAQCCSGVCRTLCAVDQ